MSLTYTKYRGHSKYSEDVNFLPHCERTEECVYKIVYNHHCFSQTKFKPVLYITLVNPLFHMTFTERFLCTRHFDDRSVPSTSQLKMASFLTSELGLKKRFVIQAMHYIRMEL